jgi:glucans biosynthesis protein C
LFLALRMVWQRWLDPRGIILAGLDRAWSALCRSRWKTVILALLTAPMLMLMDGWSVDTPKSSLLPHWPTTLLFGFQFGLGWLLHRQTALIEPLGRGFYTNLVLGVLLTLLTGTGFDRLREWGWKLPSGLGLHWGYSLLYALMMWAFVLGFLGLFGRYRRGPSPAWRYVADSSYWIYLAHLPLVVWLQIMVGRWPLPWTIKYPFILAVATPILFLSYHYLVRPTFIGKQLNGRKNQP